MGARMLQHAERVMSAVDPGGRVARRGGGLATLRAMSDWRDVMVWERLAAEGAELIAAVERELPAGAATASPAIVARLRRSCDASLVSAALELVAARRKARGKFERPDELWCDAAGVEQASDCRVAAWKAARMREVLGDRGEILDLCCGIGGDAMAMAAAGLAVTAVDLDPRRAWMTARNARCSSTVAEAESVDLAGAAIHADPARRDERGGGRSWSLDEHRPGRAWIERALREPRAAAIKFSPGVDRRAFGDAPIEWEWIESNGALVQAVAWSGRFAHSPDTTRATLVGEGRAPTTIAGTPDDARSDWLAVDGALREGAWLGEPRPSLERARLLTEALAGSGARELAPGLGLVAAPSPDASPWLEWFAFAGEVSGRAEAMPRLAAELAAAHGAAGAVRSVRVRGGAVDADALTRALSCAPTGRFVLLAWRDGGRARAALCEAMPARPS